MKTIKGPAIFLAQFMDEKPPFNSLKGLCQWAAELGYIGIQMPTLDERLIDLKLAAESQAYCDDLKGEIKSYGLEITTFKDNWLQFIRRTISCSIFLPPMN